MNAKKLNIFIIVAISIILIWLLKDTFTQKNANDLKGGFIEVASYRNENNTGPIQRIYSVMVSDIANAELEAYGNFMPHTKYGNTKVYFFKKEGASPKKLYPGSVNFDTIYNRNCIALYEKSAMGNSGLLLNPFKQTLKNL